MFIKALGFSTRKTKEFLPQKMTAVKRKRTPFDGLRRPGLALGIINLSDVRR